MTVHECEKVAEPDVSTHMPLARHDQIACSRCGRVDVSTHMPLARHDGAYETAVEHLHGFYSHASCEA